MGRATIDFLKATGNKFLLVLPFQLIFIQSHASINSILSFTDRLFSSENYVSYLSNRSLNHRIWNADRIYEKVNSEQMIALLVGGDKDVYPQSDYGLSYLSKDVYLLKIFSKKQNLYFFFYKHSFKEAGQFKDKLAALEESLISMLLRQIKPVGTLYADTTEGSARCSSCVSSDKEGLFDKFLSGSVMGGVFSCISNLASASADSVSSMASGIMEFFDNPSKKWDQLKETWTSTKDFFSDFKGNVSKMINALGGAIGFVSDLDGGQLTQIVCSVLGALGPSVILGALTGAGVGLLLLKVANALKSMGAVVKVMSALSKLGKISENTSEVINKYIQKVINGDIGFSRRKEIEEMAEINPHLALGVMKCSF